VVVEGRDTGTVVFPTADAKFFLTASAAERARRRVAELAAAGTVVDYAVTLCEIAERDDRDAGRDVAPMVPRRRLVDSRRKPRRGCICWPSWRRAAPPSETLMTRRGGNLPR
jgi:hypothetical protein